MIWLPTIMQVLEFHGLLIARTGGAPGVRDVGLIESALMRADAGFGGKERYDTLAKKTAAVCHGLIANHGFVDGNKRVGIAVMCLILQKNNTAISYTQSDLIALGLGIASGGIDVDAIADWIKVHIVSDSTKHSRRRGG